MTRWPARATHLDGTPAPTQFPTLPTLHDLRSVEMLRAALEQGMRLILSKVRPVDAAERTFEARQAVYRLDTTCELMVVRARGQAWDGPLRALEALGQHMSAFRRARHAVGLPTAPLQMLESGQSLPRAPAPAAFGLPLSYQRKGERTQYSLGPSQRWRPPSDDPSRPPSVGRMPSPILISLKRIGMGEGAEVVAVITRLSGEVPGVKLDLAHDRDPYRDIPANPGNAILQDYMKDLASNFNVQKVRL